MTKYTLFCRLGPLQNEITGPSEKFKILDSENIEQITYWINKDQDELKIPQTINYSKFFEPTWRKHKRYIINAYRRESRKKLTNLEIQRISKRIFFSLTQNLGIEEIVKVIFKENPHTYFDVLLMLAAIESKIEIVYYEYFLNNTIINRINISNGNIKKDRIRDLPQKKRPSKKLKFFEKICYIFKVFGANIFGGGIRWKPIVWDGNKCVRLNLFAKIKLSLGREFALQRYFRKFNYLKVINQSQILKSDIVIYLHFQPESSTMPYGGSFCDQLFMCWWIAKRYPKRRVIIKEHPSMYIFKEKKALCIETFRNQRILKKINRLTNVMRINSFDGNGKCWVGSINGTIIGERINIQMPTLVIENIDLLPFSGRKTVFLLDGQIHARGKSSERYTGKSLKIEDCINFSGEIL